MKAFFSPYPRVDRSDKARGFKVNWTAKTEKVFKLKEEWTTEFMEKMDRELTEMIDEGDIESIIEYLQKLWPTFFSWPEIYKYRHIKLREVGEAQSSANSVNSFSNILFSMNAWLNGMQLSARKTQDFNRGLFRSGISLIGNKIYEGSKELDKKQLIKTSRKIRREWASETLSRNKKDPKSPEGITYRNFVLSAFLSAVSNFDLLQEKNAEDLVVPSSLDNIPLSIPINGLLKPGLLQRLTLISERIYSPPKMDVPRHETTIKSIEERHNATSSIFSTHKDRLDYFSDILESTTPVQSPVTHEWFDFRTLKTGVKTLEQGPRLRFGEFVEEEKIEEVARALIKAIFKSANADAPVKEMEPYAQYERVSLRTVHAPEAEERRKVSGPVDKRKFSVRFLEVFPGYLSTMNKFRTLVRGYAQYQSDMGRYLTANNVRSLGPYPYNIMLSKDRKELKHAHVKLSGWIIETARKNKNNRKKMTILRELFMNMNAMYSSVLREQPPKLTPIAMGVLYHNT